MPRQEAFLIWFFISKTGRSSAWITEYTLQTPTKWQKSTLNFANDTFVTLIVKFIFHENLNCIALKCNNSQSKTFFCIWSSRPKSNVYRTMLPSWKKLWLRFQLKFCWSLTSMKQCLFWSNVVLSRTYLVSSESLEVASTAQTQIALTEDKGMQSSTHVHCLRVWNEYHTYWT